MAGGRVDGVERARRVNVAVGLREAGMSTVESVRVLAERFAVSARQARRYVDQAARFGRVPVPEPSVVFTVRLPVGLAQRVREHAPRAGLTISAVVADALVEFLARGNEKC